MKTQKGNVRLIRHNIVTRCEQIVSGCHRILRLPPAQARTAVAPFAAQMNWSVDSTLEQIRSEYWDSLHIKTVAEEAQLIAFSADQADVFLSTSKDYTDSLEYRLPFEKVLLQFDRPLIVDRWDDREQSMVKDEVVALVLSQIVGVKEAATRLSERVTRHSVTALDDSTVIVPKKDQSIMNMVGTVFSDWNVSRFIWEAGSFDEFAYTPYVAFADEIKSQWSVIKALAIACIGYINCENIYLHKEGEVPEKVNRKRAQQGKRILEPYYVCRIRGVQYDSNGNPTGEGTHHGFRYDVRGHFRKLASGKTTWVRPHQRGLQHELYIPKTYVVDKRPPVAIGE